jgi:hypothetical protein
MFTPWVIAFVIALLLIQAALRAKARANDSFTPEGAQTGVFLMAFFGVAALAFILVTVILAG